MKRFWKLFVTVCLLFCFLFRASFAQATTADEAPPHLTAQGAVLIDRTNGQILFEQNKDKRLYPASITKIMTCLLALERGNLNDMVTTSQLARNQDGNRVYLEVGEKEPLSQMLYGLMLNSGNDAAVAIAEHIGGSVAVFANMMNDKAAEIGAKNTHFANPNGLHDDNHYTTAYDMALIANYAMNNPKFRELVSTKTYAWHGQSWDSNLVNINPMLFDYPGATGVKTGFTDQAQQTMVVTAKRGDHEILAVLMDVVGKPLIHDEATKLLDYGFNHFTQERIGVSGDVISTFEQNGYKVNAILSEDVYADLPNGTSPQIERQIKLSKPTAPYPKGSKVGTVNYTVDGKTVVSADLVASTDVLLPKPKPAVGANLANTIYRYCLPPIVILVLLLGLRLLKNRRPINPNAL